MYQKLLSKIKPFLKTFFVISLVAMLAFSQADSALAARSGGRIGGGSFRMPTRSYSAPSRPQTGGGYYGRGGYYGGGGFGFPFLLPFFGFGGGFGGLFSILIFIAIANFLVNTLRGATQGGEAVGTENPTVTVGQVQVGLLSEARSLQTDLNRIAETADTGSAAGRAQVLQEATLSLLRHPEYWVYGAAKSEQTRLNSAEAKFNQQALAERSKFTEETLSNYNNTLTGDSPAASLSGDASKGELAETAMSQAPGEYIVVTIVVGTEGKMQLPAINNTEDLRRAISQIGAISSEQLLAVEVLWTPQASGDTLTTDDMLAEYADVKIL